MEKILKIRLLILALSMSSFFSCSKQVNLSTFRPADINVPSHVKTLVIVDRTAPKNKAVNIIEGILTGEGIGEDRNGAEEALISFQQKLLTSPRFEVKRANERLIGNSIIGTFPETLPWSQIEDLCRKYEADAVVAVEIFDTNFLVTDGKRNIKRTEEKDGQKREYEIVEYFVNGEGTCKVGFRVYDPKGKTIADQQMFNHSNSWEGVGASFKDAYAGLIQKSEATRYVSRMAGSDYATKIAPMPITISRTFYSKAKKNQYLESGTRQAEVDQWKEAIETWKQGIGFTDRKISGKISYNIAVAYEVLGDLNMAKEWANKSYVNYGNKKARSYTHLLNNRLRDIDLVNQQLQ